MGTVPKLALALCEGGGNDTLAVIVALALFALWLLAARAAVGNPMREYERCMLLVASTLLGAAIFFLPGEHFGDDYLGRFFLALLIPAALGAAVAQWKRWMSVARALCVSLTGAVLFPGGIFVLFFASLLIGSGCLE